MPGINDLGKKIERPPGPRYKRKDRVCFCCKRKFKNVLSNKDSKGNRICWRCRAKAIKT